MRVQTVCVEVNCEAESDDVAAMLRSLTVGGPFSLADVVPAGPGRLRCDFRVARADMAVGYRSVIELQHRIDREFDIVSVGHHPHHPHYSATKDLVPS